MKIDIIDQQSYEIGYAAGLADKNNEAYEMGYRECLKDERRRKNKEIRERTRKTYYILQKTLGVAALAVMCLMVRVMDGDATIALLLLPVILALIFSNKPLLIMKGGGEK